MAATVPPGHPVRLNLHLYFVPPEDIVLLPARALGTPETADQQNRDPAGYDHRQDASACYEPMNKIVHSPESVITSFNNFDADSTAAGHLPEGARWNLEWTHSSTAFIPMTIGFREWVIAKKGRT